MEYRLSQYFLFFPLLVLLYMNPYGMLLCLISIHAVLRICLPSKTMRRTFNLIITTTTILASSIILSKNTPSYKVILVRILSSAIRYKRPVYIELSRDKVLTPIPIYQERYADSSTIYSKSAKVEEGYETDMDSMQEALTEATAMINCSKQPVIIAGVEIHRFGLQDK